MRHLLAFLSGLLIAAPLAAADRTGNLIVMDAAEAAACDDGDGCALITRKALESLRTACVSRT